MKAYIRNNKKDILYHKQSLFINQPIKFLPQDKRKRNNLVYLEQNGIKWNSTRNLF